MCLAFLLIRAIVVCCILIMQDSPVKFQILPATAFHLIPRFPVILEFPEITCICATLIKSRASQQWMSSETTLSWFCPLDHFFHDDERGILDDGFCSAVCFAGIFLRYFRDCAFHYLWMILHLSICVVPCCFRVEGGWVLDLDSLEPLLFLPFC